MFWCVSSRLGAFGTISVLHETRSKTVQIEAINAVHLEPFRYYTKLEAKRDKLVQLMQQFVPRCFA